MEAETRVAEDAAPVLRVEESVYSFTLSTVTRRRTPGRYRRPLARVSITRLATPPPSGPVGESGAVSVRTASARETANASATTHRLSRTGAVVGGQLFPTSARWRRK